MIVVSFFFVQSKFPGGTVVIRWLPDVNIEFNPWKHGALILMGIVVLIFGLLYTALMLFWQLLLCCPRKFTRNQKLLPFVEACHVPYNAKHRYWTGLLLLIRIILFLISTSTETIDPYITLLATVGIMSGLLLYKTFLVIKVYKKYLLNHTVIESFTFVNIVMFTMFTWYAFDDAGDQNKKNLQKSAAYTSAESYFCFFLGFTCTDTEIRKSTLL